MVLYISLFSFIWSTITSATYAAMFEIKCKYSMKKELNTLKEGMASQKIMIKRLDTMLAKI